MSNNLKRGTILCISKWNEVIVEVLDRDDDHFHWIKVVRPGCYYPGGARHPGCLGSIVRVRTEELHMAGTVERLTMLVQHGDCQRNIPPLRFNNSEPCGFWQPIWKSLSPEQEDAFARTVKCMLHAARDTMRTRLVDTRRVPWSRTGEESEAFGMIRTLELLGYGYHGCVNLSAAREGKSSNPIHNLRWWYEELKNEVLKEEGFCFGAAIGVGAGPGAGDNQCQFCEETYKYTAMPGTPQWDKQVKEERQCRD